MDVYTLFVALVNRVDMNIPRFIAGPHGGAISSLRVLQIYFHIGHISVHSMSALYKGYPFPTSMSTFVLPMTISVNGIRYIIKVVFNLHSCGSK